MSAATRGLFAALTAALLAWPAPAPGEPLRGTVELAPLAPPSRDRPTLARIPQDRGPLWPWLDETALLVGVGDVTPVVVLGATCPEHARFGVALRLENRAPSSRRVTVGETEPVDLGAGSHLVLEPAVEPTRLVDDSDGWTCTLRWEVEAAPPPPELAPPSVPSSVIVPVRREGPGRFAFDLGELALPDAAEPGTGRPGASRQLSLRLWLGGRSLCEPVPTADAPRACQWTVQAVPGDEGWSLEPLRLAAETLYFSAEDP
jgi:hypothetical protein